jgi:molybdopterin converting factor small subunit
MTEPITIVSYGSLRRTPVATSSDKRVQSIAHRQPLYQFLETIGISCNHVQLVMVNHRAAELDTEIGAGDRVALFPKEYPIFVDWHAYRQTGA